MSCGRRFAFSPAFGPMVLPVSGSRMARTIKTGQRLSDGADHVNDAVPRCSALDPNIAAWRILNGGELAPADRPGRYPRPVPLFDPGLPVRPPRARMLLRVLKPGLEFSRGRSAGPVPITVPYRRVHNPGNMARARNDNPHGTTKELRP